ncbi:unnamed protein product [Chilo suppressalis]|uniref:Ig-like domain-containing protein n=1 Tax=Chilo suppressalis TaxID=168631 RepID=A0ABN8L5E5_CHISP|nr:hypothetical protein evm_005417 [Chilo suppressalis]CAH2987391.1 unnamed protein product [Chilo suppressalis]
MYQIVLYFAAAALLCTGTLSSNINRHLKLLDFENNIEPNTSPTKQPGVLRFLSLERKPNAAYAHTTGVLLPLTCEAIGSPAPTIRWFKNNSPVYEHDTESNEVIESNPNSLGRVTSTLLVTHSDGSDVYTCLASSASKVVRANTIVSSSGKTTDPTERSKLLPLEPRILVSYKAFVDTIGNAVVLPCKARGYPRPVISWRDNNGVLVTKNSRMKVLRSGELVISPLRWSDMGEFTCLAANVFGSGSASTFLYPAAG